MILYIENPKDSTKKPPDLINEFSKIAEYKINIQKSMAFSYTNNVLLEREIKKTIPFRIATKKYMVPRSKFNEGDKRPVLRKL